MSRKIIGASVGTPLNPQALMEKVSIDSKADAIVTSASGEVITTTDSAKAKPKNIRLYGKTEQPSTEGKNLFDISVATTSPYGFTNNGDGTLSLKGYSLSDNDGHTLREFAPRLLAGDIATINAITNGVKTIYLQGINITWAYGTSKTITEEMLNSVVYFYSKNEDGYTTTISEIMINLGTTALPFEPYTGGEASPNMNYPQPPNSHGESGSIVGKVLNGNFFDVSKISSFTDEMIAQYGYGIKVDKNGVVSVTSTQTSSGLSDLTNSELIDLAPNLQVGETYTLNAITSANTNKYIYLYGANIIWTFGTSKALTEEMLNSRVLFYSDGVGETDYISEIMLNYGTEPLPFKPYTEQPFTFQTPNGLRGIPLGQTIPDAIKNSPIHMAGVYWDNAEGQYYIGDTVENGQKVQRVVEYVINGDADISDYDKNGTNGGFAIYNVISTSYRRAGLCNSLIVNSEANDGLWIGVNNDVLYAYRNSLFDASLNDYGVANFKAHLNENPLVISTWLDDPIITDLTQEELDQYNALLMNYPNTTIINNENAYMEVEYVADTKMYIDNKFKQLEMALANTNANLL